MVRTDRAWQRPHQACADRSYAVARASQERYEDQGLLRKEEGAVGREQGHGGHRQEDAGGGLLHAVS